MFSVRQAGPDDLASINQLYAYSFSHYRQVLPEVFSEPPKDLFTSVEYAEFITDEGSRLYLAVTDSNQPAGLIALSLSNNGNENTLLVDELRQYIDDLVVLPEYADSPLPGILLDKAEELARENEVERVSSVVYPATPEIAEWLHERGYEPLSVRVQKHLRPAR